jgi:hypothetical protein
MFMFGKMPCCGMDAQSRQHARKAQLEFLKMVRDHIESRLAGVNAAIATLEQQQARAATEETAPS